MNLWIVPAYLWWKIKIDQPDWNIQRRENANRNVNQPREVNIYQIDGPQNIQSSSLEDEQEAMHNIVNRRALEPVPDQPGQQHARQPAHQGEFGLFSRIKRIPTVKVIGDMVRQWGRAYTAKDNDKQSNCWVCLEEFKKGDQIVELHCAKGHMFHPGCIEDWAKSNKSCPLCRTNFVELARKEQSNPPAEPEVRIDTPPDARNDTPPEPYLPVAEGNV